MLNTARKTMMDGGKALGTFSHLGSSYAIECLGLAGMDYVIVDTEHGPFDVESTAEYVRSARLRNISPFARVKDATRPSILKMLDIGVEGLIIPNIHTVQEVRDIVEYGKFFPVGRRGVAPTRYGGWGFDLFACELPAYFDACNLETMLIPQCETKGCLDKIDEIVSIEGVAGIFIGPYDLSVALGKPAVFDDTFQKAVDRVYEACKSAEKYCMIYAGDAQAAKRYFEKGFNGVAVGIDAIALINSYQKLVQDVKGE